MANPFVGEANVASPQSVFSTYSTPAHAVGTRGVLADRSFRYVKFMDGTAIGPNKLAAMAPPVANHVTQTDTGFAPIANDESVSIVLGATAAGEQEYQDGYLKLQSATLGIGQIFKLRGHGYVAASGTLTAKLYDPVVTGTSGTEIYSLLHNPFSYVVIQPTTATAAAAGVTLVNYAAVATASVATSGYLQTGTTTWTQPRYGWLQTWGLASVLGDTSDVVAGSSVIYGATAGTVGVAVETDIKQRVGVAVEAMATNSQYLSIFLQIAP